MTYPAPDNIEYDPWFDDKNNYLPFPYMDDSEPPIKL